MNDNNSAALQGHLNPEPQAESSESADQRPKDIHCPEMVTKGLNSYRQTCVERISARQVKLYCRRCEVGQKMAQELNVILTGLKVKGMCECGEPREYDKQYCGECRNIMEKEAERKRALTNDRTKPCKCGAAREYRHMYCAECAVKNATEKRIKRETKREAERLQRKILQLNKKLNTVNGSFLE